MNGWSASELAAFACALAIVVGPIYVVTYFARLSR